MCWGTDVNLLGSAGLLSPMDAQMFLDTDGQCHSHLRVHVVLFPQYSLPFEFTLLLGAPCRTACASRALQGFNQNRPLHSFIVPSAFLPALCPTWNYCVNPQGLPWKTNGSTCLGASRRPPPWLLLSVLVADCESIASCFPTGPVAAKESFLIPVFHTSTTAQFDVAGDRDCWLSKTSPDPVAEHGVTPRGPWLMRDHLSQPPIFPNIIN